MPPGSQMQAIFLESLSDGTGSFVS